MNLGWSRQGRDTIAARISAGCRYADPSAIFDEWSVVYLEKIWSKQEFISSRDNHLWYERQPLFFASMTCGGRLMLPSIYFINTFLLTTLQKGFLDFAILSASSNLFKCTISLMTIPPTKQETSTFIVGLLPHGNEEFIYH